MANRSSVWEVFIVRRRLYFPPSTGPRRLSRIVMAPSPSKTNSMTRLRRSKKLLTISLSVHFHFLQAKISLNKGLQLLATHVIYLVYIVKRPSWNRPLPPQAKSSQDVCGECFLSIFETFASPLSLT